MEIDIQQRFWNRTARKEYKDCWPWLGTINDEGYGMIKIDGKIHRAHRLSYLIQNGPIADGLVIDHICENKSCVNPMHLSAVTVKQNNRRYQNSRKPKIKRDK